jgi:hypothetical protein
MAEKITPSAIGAVLDGIMARANDELANMPESQLEQFWYFEWNPGKSPARNTYEFTKMLDLYRSQCRRWEEMHNGRACVVERVRDKYLMPKINEFAARMTATPTPKG